MTDTYLIFLALGLAFWCLWLERKLRRLEDERDAVLHVLHGVATGTHTLEQVNGKFKVNVKGENS